MHTNKPKNSEVDAYTYIKEELEKLGWVVKNPARFDVGEVYKQNEVLSHKELKKMLVRDMPEAVVKLDNSGKLFWIIESKRNKENLEKALNEAKNQYAEKINKSKSIKAILVSGVAGNDSDGYIVRNQILINSSWKTILFEESKIKNILLSKEQVKFIFDDTKKEIIKKKDSVLYKNLPDTPEEKYIEVAENINEILHNAGINKNKRARFIAGLVLAYSTGSINRTNENTKTLVDYINILIDQKLRDVGKENFINFLKLEVPPVVENHIKYREAIKKSLNELDTLDIVNAMNSGKDVLGGFYEKFLKYGNGAKEIGIVLTPRHITEFAVNVLDVNHNDYVLDPTCGTGGFLVSSFDYIKKKANINQVDKFKNYNLFGIEQEDEVVALALVNMIFRGDGRNNMSSGNCFYKNINKIIKEGNVTGDTVLHSEPIKENSNPIITKVLMNPPFALKNSKEKEKDFIDYALKQMDDGGILFAIVPISVMVEGGTGKNWRKELLENNTLLSVITFPEDLFYPVSVGTIGVFLKKGAPHNFDNQNIYFARSITDGLRKKKGKRVTDKRERNQIKEIREELKAFLVNQNLKFKNIPEFKKICKLDKEDKNIELVPEAYIDSKIPTHHEIEMGIEKMVRESVAFKIKFYNQLNQNEK